MSLQHKKHIVILVSLVLSALRCKIYIEMLRVLKNILLAAVLSA